MKTFKLLFIFEFALISLIAEANCLPTCGPGENSVARPVHFLIEIESDRPMRDSLEIYFWRDYINGLGHGDGSVYFKTPPINGKGYQFVLPSIDHVGRLVLVNNQLGNFLISQVVEPGDSIIMSAKFLDRHDFDITFKGTGAAKYNFIQAVKLKAEWQEFEKEKEPFQMTKLVDSLLNKQLSVLDHHKNISDQTKMILKLDLIGEVRKQLLSRLRYDYRQVDPKTKLKFESTLVSLSEPKENDLTAITFSKYYTEYLYEKEKLKLIYSKGDNETSNGTNFSFKDLYNVLKSEYKGVVREKLITYCIMNAWDMTLFFKGSDPDDYTFCLNNALSIIQTPYLRTAVQKELLTRGKGAIAFDFALPDSTGKIVNLHDFRGKVVFVDIWSNPCGGCKKFKQYFEEKVYPKIKDNPEIEIVSIALNKKREKWLEGLSQYSHPDFINLYTGGLGSDHPLTNHYNIMGIPYFLLVDRNGKIYSATIPFIERGDDLLALIKRCLSER